MKATHYKRAAFPIWEMFSHKLRYSLYTKLLLPCFFLFISFVKFPFLIFCSIFDTANEIQPVSVGTGAGVATEVMKQNDDGKGGEFLLHSFGQGWTVAR